METIPLTKKHYRQWDDFCLKSDDAWFWHTSKWIEYQFNYKVNLKPESKSFMIMDSNKILAICPLIIEDYGEVKEFSFGSMPGPTPVLANGLTYRKSKQALKTAFQIIDQLAKENNIARARFSFSVLSRAFIQSRYPRFNYLLQFGFLDNPIGTQVLDLRMPLSVLKREIRHGHWYDINRGQKMFKVEIFDKNNANDESFDEYVKMHCRHHQKGSELVRPEATYEKMRGFIKQGYGFLAGVKKDGRFVNFAYFYVYKNNVYWGSSCMDKSSAGLPAGHILQWSAIQWMREQGYQFYEIGWQDYLSSFSYLNTKKEVNIGRFKRGFGGFTTPLFTGEKYYDKDYFLKVYQSRINNFADSI